MILNSPYISGSSTITGNLTVLGSISGSTNSAISASYALNATSASYALNATSASYALNTTTSSFALNATSASYSNNSTSASYAVNSDLLDGRDSTTFANTGSNSFVGTQNINGSVAITGSLTTTGTITAQTLNVQQVTSSIVYSSGSNVFGNSVSNTQSMTGSVGISGSLSVNGVSTLSGALSGTTLSLVGTNNVGIKLKQGNQILDTPLSTNFYNGLVFENTSTTNAWGIGYSQGAAFSINYFDGASTYSRYISITNAGAVTLTGALSGTSATFSGGLVLNSTDFRYHPVSATAGNAALVLKSSSTGVLSVCSEIFGDANVNSNSLSLRVSNPDQGRFNALTIASTGAATFSSLATGAVYSTSGTLTNTAPSITATGGTIVTSGGFKYHTFTSSGTFQVTAGSGIVEVFVLGGGGAGGGDFSGLTFYAGGGGAGGGLYNPAYYVEVASYTVTIGAGGAINPLGNAFGGDGGSSVFGNITALGGGGGSRGNVDSSSSYLGRDGGCGGGGGSSNSVAGITIQSITNGVAYGNGGANGSGAAGGGGGIGTQPTANTFGGFGKYVMNQANRIGGGGGGGTFADGGVNAYDGGGRGGRNGSAGGTAGTANTGGGGGGLGYITGNGGAGGSGIVIVKYKA